MLYFDDFVTGSTPVGKYEAYTSEKGGQNNEI
jgi:hypothetical protein